MRADELRSNGGTVDVNEENNMRERVEIADDGGCSCGSCTCQCEIRIEGSARPARGAADEPASRGQSPSTT